MSRHRNDILLPLTLHPTCLLFYFWPWLCCRQCCQFCLRLCRIPRPAFSAQETIYSWLYSWSVAIRCIAVRHSAQANFFLSPLRSSSAPFPSISLFLRTFAGQDSIEFCVQSVLSSQLMRTRWYWTTADFTSAQTAKCIPAGNFQRAIISLFRAWPSVAIVISSFPRCFASPIPVTFGVDKSVPARCDTCYA